MLLGESTLKHLGTSKSMKRDESDEDELEKLEDLEAEVEDEDLKLLDDDIAADGNGEEEPADKTE